MLSKILIDKFDCTPEGLSPPPTEIESKCQKLTYKTSNLELGSTPEGAEVECLIHYLNLIYKYIYKISK